MTQKYRTAASALLALCSGLAAAADTHPVLQRFLIEVQSLEAQFTQTQSDEQGKVLQTSSGQMWLQRASGGADDAGRFRWDYATPYAQEIVCDGQRIWLYDPDLAQVTVRPARDALQGTPAALLSQSDALKGAFTVTDGGVEASWQKILLAPKSADSEFRRIEIWFDGKLPMRLRFEDPLGGSTDIRFREVRGNPSIKAQRFEFKPPKGVEIVDAGAK